MITITHTHEDGTLIEGSSKGDGVWEILLGLRRKGQGNWRSFPSIGRLGIGQSRDKSAQTWRIEAAATALRAAGFDVTVEIDEGESRSFAEQEAERYGRAEERADRQAGYADNAASRSAAAFARVQQIADGIPFGQPILVGHHSERHARADQRRMHDGMRKGIDEDRKADYHAGRADTAARYQQHRENVPATLRRIEKLEAEQRQAQRRLDGTDRFYSYGTPASGTYRERLERRVADIAEEVTYWRELVAKRQAEETGVKVWSREDFTRGDYVQFIGTWYEVVRVNAKSLTIPAMINDGAIVHKDGNRCTWTDTIPYHKVTGRKSAAEIAEIIAAAEAKAAS